MVDGDRLNVMGLAGNVACLQVADGKVVWQRNLRTDFGGQSSMWSFRESPIVEGDKVICTPGGEATTIAALNQFTRRREPKEKRTKKIKKPGSAARG